MAKTLADKRRRLNELAREGVSLHWNQVMQLAYELYDPMYLRILKENNRMRARLEKESVAEDAVQRAYWNRCKAQVPEGGVGDREELLHEVFLSQVPALLRSFDPKKAKLTTYLEYYLEKRVIDRVGRDFGRSQAQIRIPLSLSAPLGEESGGAELSLGDTLCAEDKSLEEAEGRADRTEAKAFEFIAHVLLLARDRDRTNSLRLTPKKLRSFRVVYSAGVINIEHDGEAEPEFRYRRRVEEALEALFLDHCLVVPDCRTLTAVRRSPIKAEHFKPFPKNRDDQYLMAAVLSGRRCCQ